MKISVVMPVYNAAAFLRRAIESVLAQSHREIELILVDDGSADDSAAICRTYAGRYDSIRAFSQRNGGPAAARNTGVRHASGETVFFLDADDYLPDDTLAALAREYVTHRPDMVLGNFSKLIGEGRVVKQQVCFGPDAPPFTDERKFLSRQDVTLFLRHFLKHPSNHLMSYCWARLYKLSLIREHGIAAREDMRLFEDFVFNLEYLKHAEKVIFLNIPVYAYVMHGSHLSASMDIVDGARLLHDMELFRTVAADFLAATPSGQTRSDAHRQIGHALIHYVIIFLVRSCRQLSSRNRDLIRGEFVKIVDSPILRESLPCYRPFPGTSRLIPLLMRLRLITPLMYLGRHKAYRRYGRPLEALSC